MKGNEPEDNFMKTFKYYKANKPKPSYENVITLDHVDKDKIESVHFDSAVDLRTEQFGLKKLSEWKIYSLKEHPGLILISNPFTSLGQRYWIRRCLEVYPRKPNKKNIDIEMDLDDWWLECFTSGQCDRCLQKKLRWTTLGYHHNWDTKVYSEENKSTFPEDLAELCDVVATYLGYTKFRAEAAIVNYYHRGTTLSAHTDHSEVNLEAPLFSFSFGQSAVFLIGGDNKSIEPSAILLKSGDIVVMSKEARLCFHAVPKILPALTQPWNASDLTYVPAYEGNFKMQKNDQLFGFMNQNIDDKEWCRFNSYAVESRININVRQVLNENQSSLCNAKDG